MLSTFAVPSLAAEEVCGPRPGIQGTVCEVKPPGTSVTFSIYLPRNYDRSGTRRYPVVYHLHGITGTHDGNQVISIPASHEAAAARGLVEDVIIVFPDGYSDSWWANSFDGKKPAESDVIQRIIPYVDAHYLTEGVREFRIIEGYSMGGFGAAKFAAKFPDRFAGCVIYDGALLRWSAMQTNHPLLASTIFNNSATYFAQYSPWKFITDAVPSAIWPIPFRQAVGQLQPANEDFQTHLFANDIVPSFFDAPVTHDLKLVLDSREPSDSNQTVGDVSWAFIQSVFDGARPTPFPSISILGEDGYITESSESANTGGAFDAGAANFLVGDTASRQQLRAILSFDTSLIPAGATILSASVTLTRVGGSGSTATLQTLRGDVKRGTFNTAALAAGDFATAATVAAGIPSFVVPTQNSKPTTGAFTTAALGAINRTGKTQIRLAFSTDDDNDAVADNVAFASSNNALAELRPVLQVTYH
ncbi:MAG TPA: alpha/beta hydrolase-fold protein [Polyangiaceae bacterium]